MSRRPSHVARTWLRRIPPPATAALAAGAAVVTLAAQTAAPGPALTPREPPRLLVLIVVDQLRADYIEMYGDQWTRGLRRLLDEGALFARATYPYAFTKTCAGYSTISTGTTPAAHGMIDNEWFDARTRAYVPCTADPSAAPIPFAGGPGAERHGPALLRRATFSDELRRQQPGARVVSLALKARAAISLAGRGGPDTVVAWEEDSGAWATSTSYARSPWPEVDAFVRANPPATARGQTWARLLPATAYRHADRAAGEPQPNMLPRLLIAPRGVSFTAVWDASPWSDAYLATMAAALVDRLALGQRIGGTDLLALGFSALDYLGHNYGPRSHEVQDLLARLDLAMAGLLDTLDRRIGRGRYTVAFTSDHGVAPLPEQAEEAGVRAGRVDLNALGLAIDLALGEEFGPRRFIQTISSTYVHFHPGVLETVRGRAGAASAVVEAARAVPGIAHAYWADDLASTAPTSDAVLAALRRSYVRGRSGDLAFLPAPYWVVSSAGTTHGSLHPYDTDVPLIVFGARVRSGRYATASPLDVAPTLAALAGVTMPAAEGRVLSEALLP
jgi:hypothetical protein